MQAVPVTRKSNLARAVPSLTGLAPLTYLLLDSPGISNALSSAADRHLDIVPAFGSGMARFCKKPPPLSAPRWLTSGKEDAPRYRNRRSG